MQEWFLGLDSTMQVFWGVAIFSSAVFLIQLLLTVLGIDSTDAGDIDLDLSDGDTMDTGGAMSLFSIRSLVNFLVGFGWAGVTFRSTITNDILLYLVSAIVGLAFSSAYVFLKKKLTRLESKGNRKPEDAVGKSCSVYLRIPANRTGSGKVHVSINGAVTEFEAVTEGDEIPSGAHAKVVSVCDTILKVERI